MQLSIIIALYNTERYIEKCIKSVLNSSLAKEDYEIIVINDGSIDKSKEIVESLMLTNTNIKLINKENGGQSSARNLGFQKARGEYIFCLDSDDYVDGNLFKKALNFAVSNDLDMLPIQFVRIDEDGTIYDIKDTYIKFDNIISGADFLNRFVIAGAMARYFYKTKIIKENNLKLLEGIYHEDEEFVVKFLTKVNRIKYNQLPVYYYLDRHNSTIRNKDLSHRKKLMFDLISVVDSLNEIIKNSNNEYLIRGIKKKKQQLLLSIFLRMYIKKFDKSSIKEIVNVLKSKDYYPLSIDQLNWKHKSVAKVLNMPLIDNLLFK